MKVLNERACLIARVQSMHGLSYFSLIPPWFVSEPQKTEGTRASETALCQICIRKSIALCQICFCLRQMTTKSVMTS